MPDITIGNATDGGNNLGVSASLTFSHTNNGDTVAVCFNGDNFGGADDIASVTYAGVACSLRVKITSATGGDRITYIYDLIGTAAGGANNVVITASSTHLLQGGALSLSNVLGADVTQTNFSGITDLNLTTTFTTLTDRDVAVLVEGCYNAGNPPSAGSNTFRQTFDATNGGWGIFTHALMTPLGAYDMETKRSSNPFSLAIVHAMVAYKPTGAASGPTLPQLERGIRGMARGLVMGGAA